MSRLSSLGLLILGALFLGACQPIPTAPLESRTAAVSASATPIPPPTSTETPLPTLIPTRITPTFPPSATPAPWLCSPLEGYRLDQMPSLVVNPFAPPPPGSDDPHQGIDLADRQPGSLIALSGRLVQAALGGNVAAVIRDRFPYGNALLVESPLTELPGDWVAALNLDVPFPTPRPNLALTCPDVVPKNWQAGQSLYLLYAHLLQPPEFKSDDRLTCGQGLGKVGASGNALNPHLHLEVRLGPAGARFSSLAHYDNRATLEEMDNYCTWRVRGIFRLLDPLQLLGLPEK